MEVLARDGKALVALNGAMYAADRSVLNSIKAANDLCEELGDAAAYKRVQDHFRVMLDHQRLA